MPHVHLNLNSPTYAPPVLRAPSPASSLGTVYPLDATSLSDEETEISQVAFESKWEDKLRLGREFVREWKGEVDTKTNNEQRWGPRDRDREGWGVEPLIAKGEGGRTPAEDKFIHEQILRSLRYQVHLLEEDELFEQTLLRGSQVALAPQPESSDIDALMRSMMSVDPTPPSLATRMHPALDNVADRATITAGPWNRGPDTSTMGETKTSTPAIRMGGVKGKGRGRR